MPKVKELYVNLPKLLRCETFDLLMLGYVLGYRHISPYKVLQVKAAIEKFIEDFELTEQDFPLDSAIVRFYNKYNDLSDFPDKESGHKWLKFQKNGKRESNERE